MSCRRRTEKFEEFKKEKSFEKILKKGFEKILKKVVRWTLNF